MVKLLKLEYMLRSGKDPIKLKPEDIGRILMPSHFHVNVKFGYSFAGVGATAERMSVCNTTQH